MKDSSAILEIHGVRIGMRFRTGKHQLSEVVDILEKRSLKDGSIIGYECIAKGLVLATNQYSVPFASVLRGRE